jgi:hypothetical protein
MRVEALIAFLAEHLHDPCAAAATKPVASGQALP